MIITCQHCNTKLTIPDHKVPANKDATLKCPKCQGKIQIPSTPEPAPGLKAPVREGTPSFQDRKSVLICMDSDAMKQQVQPLLRQMGFSIDTAPDTRTALDKMEYHIYHLVFIDDGFEQEKGLDRIVTKMNNMDMSLRRRICLALVSRKFKTNDNMAALHSSVNCIIRKEDLVHLDAFLLKALADHGQLYTVYNDSLKQAGKA